MKRTRVFAFVRAADHLGTAFGVSHFRNLMCLVCCLQISDSDSDHDLQRSISLGNHNVDEKSSETSRFQQNAPFDPREEERLFEASIRAQAPPSSSSSRSVPAGKWSCCVCTFDNPDSNLNCEICRTSRFQ